MDGDIIYLMDITADDISLDFIDNMETNKTVRAVVDIRSEPYKCVITAFFFEGISFIGYYETA